MLQRACGVVQNDIDALPDGIGLCTRLLAKIDCQNAEILHLSSNGADEPQVTFTVIDDAIAAGILAASNHGLGLALDPFWHPLLIGQCRTDAASRCCFEQDRSTANDRRQVLSDSGVDVACGVGSGE